MKKIFTTIIALAALVGCNTDVMEEVATTPAYLTTSFEVDLNNDTRLFDENLSWSWTSDDKIAALQLAGENSVNELKLNDNGKFFNNEFKYATEDSATFLFVYPFEAYIDTQTVGYVQNGTWTPTLVGTASGTIDNLGTVTMSHASAAFEIRVWDEGRTARKTIKSATISSTENFCNATSATVSVNSDTVVFNIAEGTFPFDITLTATDGKTYTVSKELTFELGKRTILNVEWKTPSVSFLAYSSYNESDGDVIKNDGLSGNTIYVKDVVTKNVESADIASIKLLINGVERADITSGSATVANLAYGEYKVAAKLTLRSGDSYTTASSVVYVTGIPYHADWRSKDYSDWVYIKCKDDGDNIVLNNNVTAAIVSPEFYAPNGSLPVYTAVAASTNATSIGGYTTGYVYAGTRGSSASKTGSTFSLGYVADFGGYTPDTPLVTASNSVNLTSGTPCIVVVTSDFIFACNTYIFQVKITYNK